MDSRLPGCAAAQLLSLFARQGFGGRRGAGNLSKGLSALGGFSRREQRKDVALSDRHQHVPGYAPVGVVPPPRPAAHARYAAGRAGQLRAQGRAAHAAGGKPAPQTERSRAPLLLSGFFRDGNRAGAEYQPVFGFRAVEKGEGSAQARNGRRLWGRMIAICANA